MFILLTIFAGMHENIDWSSNDFASSSFITPMSTMYINASCGGGKPPKPDKMFLEFDHSSNKFSSLNLYSKSELDWQFTLPQKDEPKIDLISKYALEPFHHSLYQIPTFNFPSITLNLNLPQLIIRELSEETSLKK